MLNTGTHISGAADNAMPERCEGAACSGNPNPSKSANGERLMASGLLRSHEARSREAAAATEGNQRVTAYKPRAALCLRRSVRYHNGSRQRTASPWRGLFREGRSGEVAAVTERTHLATELKQRAASSPSALCTIPLR